MRGGKTQLGNQGGRTITTRLNHKEVILLFCLGVGQEGEVFAVLRDGELGCGTQCTRVHKQEINQGYQHVQTNAHRSAHFEICDLFRQLYLIKMICCSYQFNIYVVLCKAKKKIKIKRAHITPTQIFIYSLSVQLKVTVPSGRDSMQAPQDGVH